MAVKKGQGDDYFNRLLSYFKQQFKEPIIKMIPIRDSVFLIHTNNNSYVFKGYSKYKKLRIQETFTATLNQEGFGKTYLFRTELFKEPPYFEEEYFGCMEYIQPNQKEFTYYSHSNRKEGLELLHEYHSITASFVKRYKTLIPSNDLQEKWMERLKWFKNNASLINRYVNEMHINELLDWSKWSLKGIKENESFFFQEPHVILHGDVAHHNFLRDITGTLNLIDFDLIGIGPASLDVLQYSNRILPYIDWSLDGLRQYKRIAVYLKEKAFLYALAFPTDILREWNRVMRDNPHPKKRHYQHTIELTLDQFHMRRNFFNELKQAVAER